MPLSATWTWMLNMRLNKVPNLFKLNRLKKLRKDFIKPWAAFIAASGISSKTHTLRDKKDGQMQVNRDDLPVWLAYFSNKECNIKIQNGLFYVIPKNKNHPSYYIKGANSKLTHQPKRWSEQTHPLISELEQSEQQFFSQHGEDGVIQKIFLKFQLNIIIWLNLVLMMGLI